MTIMRRRESQMVTTTEHCYIIKDDHITDLVRAKGSLATTTQEDSQVGNNDEEQLAYAVSQQKTLLTHNRIDFEQLARRYVAGGLAHYSIIIAIRRSPYEIARRVLVLLN